MGTQHLLIIVLSVVIVFFAVAAGVTQFYSNARDTNRDAVIADLVNHAAKAQRYFYTPGQLGGGSRNFNGYLLRSAESSNPNGNYRVTADTLTIMGAAPVSPGGSIDISATTIYIVGSGKEKGNDNANPVKAYVTVTSNTISASILN